MSSLPSRYLRTRLGRTSPPFDLVRKKDYGNVAAAEYLCRLRPFAERMNCILKDSGSLVIDIGGAWESGTPTRVSVPNSRFERLTDRGVASAPLPAASSGQPITAPSFAGGYLLVDPFAGSCVTGEVAERLGRKWMCGELIEEYLAGAPSRFPPRTPALAMVATFPQRRGEPRPRPS